MCRRLYRFSGSSGPTRVAFAAPTNRDSLLQWSQVSLPRWAIGLPVALLLAHSPAEAGRFFTRGGAAHSHPQLRVEGAVFRWTRGRFGRSLTASVVRLGEVAQHRTGWFSRSWRVERGNRGLFTHLGKRIRLELRKSGHARMKESFDVVASSGLIALDKAGYDSRLVTKGERRSMFTGYLTSASIERIPRSDVAQRLELDTLTLRGGNHAFLRRGRLRITAKRQGDVWHIEVLRPLLPGMGYSLWNGIRIENASPES